MKILVAACMAPFMPGGADDHIQGLAEALGRAGHQVASLRLPFKFSPPAAIESLMTFCEGYDVKAPNGVPVDCLLSLQFPAYGLRHDNHRLWLMHQHRAAYELYDEAAADPAERALTASVRAFDRRVLPTIPKRFANSRRVAERLAHFNHLDSEPLYHPPRRPEQYYCEPAEGYVFCPSRLEGLKRQDLLIEAARHLRTPAVILIAGDGGQRARYQQLIERLEVEHRVRLLGRISDAEKRVCYARALAVFFGPRDEDYGYVTLEAMLAEKPVITCADSGGPLELVRHEQTGLIVPPEPAAIADAIDRLYRHPDDAAAFGRTGRWRYDNLDISWERVVDRLLAP